MGHWASQVWTSKLWASKLHPLASLFLSIQLVLSQSQHPALPRVTGAVLWRPVNTQGCPQPTLQETAAVCRVAGGLAKGTGPSSRVSLAQGCAFPAFHAEQSLRSQ